jgi:hypothetical protein
VKGRPARALAGVHLWQTPDRAGLAEVLRGGR